MKFQKLEFEMHSRSQVLSRELSSSRVPLFQALAAAVPWAPPAPVPVPHTLWPCLPGSSACMLLANPLRAAISILSLPLAPWSCHSLPWIPASALPPVAQEGEGPWIHTRARHSCHILQQRLPCTRIQSPYNSLSSAHLPPIATGSPHSIPTQAGLLPCAGFPLSPVPSPEPTKPFMSSVFI